MELKLLWYCTKNKPYLQVNKCVLPTEHDRYIVDKKQRYSAFGEPLEKLNGKIVAECDCDVSNIYGCIDKKNQPYYEMHSCCVFHEYWLSEKSCLSHDELVKYLGAYKGLVGHAIHIKNLEIFDKPKELSDVYKIVDVGGMLFTDTLKKAPQNMMYVSVNPWEYSFYNPEDERVLISVRPEWLCLILNGLKDVEVRRKVLKEML